MNISQENKNYFIYVLKYLGVALVSGSVVHIGTLQSGATRYAILLLIGLVLMIFGNIVEAKQSGNKIDAKFLTIITLLAFGTGFLSGGVQHYFDNPVYSGYLLGIGVIVSYVTFFLNDGLKPTKKNTIIAALVSIAIIFASNFIAHEYADVFSAGHGGDHHGAVEQSGHHGEANHVENASASSVIQEDDHHGAESSHASTPASTSTPVHNDADGHHDE